MLEDSAWLELVKRLRTPSAELFQHQHEYGTSRPRGG